MGRRRRDLPRHAGDGGRDGRARRDDRAARARIRLGHRADFQRTGSSPAAVRVVRSVRRGVHESLRAPPRDDLRGRADCDRAARLAGDDAGVATDSALGRRRRRRHRPHRRRPGGHRGDPLVHRAPRPGGGPAHGEFGDRSTCLPAAYRRHDRSLRLARRADRCLRPSRPCRADCARPDARPPERCRPAARTAKQR